MLVGRDPYAGGSIYCATKSAVRSFTECLRRELVATRIRVMEIDPGQVETEFSLVRFDGDRSKADAVYRSVPQYVSKNPSYSSRAHRESSGTHDHENMLIYICA